jgi:outer membrane immunogenic protein
MKKAIVAAMSFTALVAPAMAADLYVKAPPPAPACVWCGFYIGATAGYTWSDQNVTTAATPTFISPLFPLGAGAEVDALASAATTDLAGKTTGFIGGGEAGYNMQFGGWIAGIETDIQGIANGRSTSVVGATVHLPAPFPTEFYSGTVIASKSLDYLGTVRGRFGFLTTPNLLLYGTGGLAYGGISSCSTYSFQESSGGGLLPVSVTSSASQTKVGWTAGVGGEWMFASRWSAKLEYLHYDLGSVSSIATLNQFNTVIAAPATVVYHSTQGQSSTRFDGDVVRVGVNYKFW